MAEHHRRNRSRRAHKQDTANQAGNSLVAVLWWCPPLLSHGHLRNRLRDPAVRANGHEVSQVAAAVCTFLQSRYSGATAPACKELFCGNVKEMPSIVDHPICICVVSCRDCLPSNLG